MYDCAIARTSECVRVRVCVSLCESETEINHVEAPRAPTVRRDYGSSPMVLVMVVVVVVVVVLVEVVVSLSLLLLFPFTSDRIIAPNDTLARAAKPAAVIT